jgi:hypothetical protein
MRYSRVKSAAAAAVFWCRTLKIIATLGPATWTPDGMKTLLDAGVDVVSTHHRTVV